MRPEEAVQTQNSQTAPSLTDFAEQGAVYDGLMKTLREGTTVHAYLISGMPGVGKRTLAGLIAQHLLCTEAEKPCGRCAACIQVREGNHPDVVIVQPGIPINPEVEKNLKSIPVDEIRKVNEIVNQHTFNITLSLALAISPLIIEKYLQDPTFKQLELNINFKEENQIYMVNIL